MMTEVSRMPNAYRAGLAAGEGVDRLLSARMNAVVGTTNNDGSIHMAPVWFLFKSSRIYFETNSATRKARNISDRAMASVFIKGKDADGDTITILASGVAGLLSTYENRDLVDLLRDKYLSPEGRHALDAYLNKIDDVLAEVKVGDWISWNGRNINGEIRAALLHGDRSWDECFLPSD